MSNNSSGYYNVGIGAGALDYNYAGIQNTAVGYQTLYLNGNSGAGNDNTALGFEALQLNRSSENAAVGSQALQNNVNGSSNVAMGYTALQTNNSGSNNTAIGYSALLSSTSDENTAVGNDALWNSTGGGGNTAVGNDALSGVQGGANNTAIGNGADVSIGASGISNATAIGYNARVGESNAMVLGNGSINVGIGTSTPGFTLEAVGSGYFHNSVNIGNNNGGSGNRLYLAEGDGNHYIYSSGSSGNQMFFGEYNGSYDFVNTEDGVDNLYFRNGYIYALGYGSSSDLRIKCDIRNSHYGLKDVLALRPVEYYLTGSDAPQLGLIAQEVKKVIPEVVLGTEGDLTKREILSIQYANIVPALISAIKELNGKIDSLKEENDCLKTGKANTADLQQLQQKVTELQKKNEQLKSDNTNLINAKADASDVSQLKLQLEQLRKLMQQNGITTQK
jgi:FtsZ-binding cell division protein ZapB